MTDLDELMSSDPLSLSEQDLNAIIAYHRNNRAKEGTKAPKAKTTVDLSALVKALAIKGVEEVERKMVEKGEKPPLGSGLRRV